MPLGGKMHLQSVNMVKSSQFPFPGPPPYFTAASFL